MLVDRPIIHKTVKYIDQSDNRFLHMFDYKILKNLISSSLISHLKK